MLTNIKGKIRNWLIKVSKWLLKKMGCYELSIVKFKPKYITELPLITVGASCFVSDYTLYGLPNEPIIENTYRELAQKLGEEVIKNATFSKADSNTMSGTVYRAEVKVIKQESDFFELVCKQ